MPLAYALILWLAAFAMLRVSRPNLQLQTDNALRIAAGEELPVVIKVTNPVTATAGESRVIGHLLPADN